MKYNIYFVEDDEREVFFNTLNENEIEYISEFTINECRKINPLPFDFLLKDFPNFHNLNVYNV